MAEDRRSVLAFSGIDVEHGMTPDLGGDGLANVPENIANVAIGSYWPFLTVATDSFGSNRDGHTSTVAGRCQTSVCSAISNASSTSMPRYRTVLSSFVWPSRS